MTDREYRGVRSVRDGACVYVVDGAQMRPIAHPVKHSPSGLEWGYGGSGPADCARALLYDALAIEPPSLRRLNRITAWDDLDAGAAWVEQNYQTFKHDLVVALPRGGWSMPARTVVEWAQAHGYTPTPAGAEVGS